MAAAEGWKQSGDVVGIPAPSGPHAVGCVDLMHKFPGDEDGLLVRLFYPSEGGAGYKYSQCTPDNRYNEAVMGVFAATFPPLRKLLEEASLAGEEPGPEPLCPALAEAPLLKPSASQAFPVVVFSHGLTGMRTVNIAVCSDLASHGYVVASVEHRDKSACASLRRVPKPGGAPGELQDAWLEYHLDKNPANFELRHTQVKQRASEVGKSLDLLGLLNEGADVQNMMDVKFDFGQFRGRLDLSRAAVMGHSFGGGTTVQALLTELGQGFKCGIAMDAWMFPIHEDALAAGTSKPLLFVNSHLEFQWQENVQKMLRLSKVPDENGISTCQVLTIRNSGHMNQCDALFVMPEFFVKFVDKSRIDPTLAHTVNMELCHSFLGRFLLQDPAYQGPVPILDGGDGRSEDVITVNVNDLPVDQPLPPQTEDVEEGKVDAEQ